MILISCGTRKVDPGSGFLSSSQLLVPTFPPSQCWTPPPAYGVKAYLRVVRSEDGMVRDAVVVSILYSFLPMNFPGVRRMEFFSVNSEKNGFGNET